ncbi:ead/Ea22-like family protein [Brevundimonas bullata]|uniref:ead/Ea22-like family protein n=1 Tax=Brevundimonas bullata TaxID=13160 RepID=UPI003D9A1007
MTAPMPDTMSPREKVEPCFECGSTERIGSACAPCNPELAALASSGDHAELARLAEAATPGPWSAADWDDDFGENKFTVQATEPEKLSLGQSSIWPDGNRCLRVAETVEGERPAEDAAFIAAANPAAVLALLSEIAALRGEACTMRGRLKLRAHVRDRWMSRATQAERQRDEAFGLLRELADGRSQKNNINEYDDLSVRASTLLAKQGAE